MARTDIGRAVPLLKGEYSPTTTYELNDIVSLNGSFYWHYSHEQTTNVAPQATSTWKVVINLADAEAYIARAEVAAESAEDAAEIATAAKTAAESASTTATGASATATTAKNDAVTAKTAAETAQAGAVTAKTAAETARDAAQASATAAGTSATNAGNSAGTAEYYAGIATTAGETASEKATEATGAATTATSAAATATSAKDTAVSSASTASTAATTATSAATAAQAVKDSIPQDYTSLSEDVADLKTQITKYTGITPIPLVASPGYIDLSGSSVVMADGVPQITGTQTAFSVWMTSCIEGEPFVINGVGGNAPRLYGFVKANGDIITAYRAPASATKTDFLIYAPEDAAWIITHTNDGRESYKGIFLPMVDDKVDDLKGEVDDIAINADKVPVIEREISDITDNSIIALNVHKYIDLSGTSVTMSGGVPQSSGYSELYSYGCVACQYGDKFTISGTGGGSTRLYGFVKSNGEILTAYRAPASATETKKVITAPKGAAWLIIHTNDDSVSYVGELLTNRVADLNDRLNSSIYLDWRNGTIDMSTGAEYTSTNRVRTYNYIDYDKDIVLNIKSGAKVSIRAYNAEGAVVYASPEWITSSGKTLGYFISNDTNVATFRLIAAYVDDSNTTDARVVGEYIELTKNNNLQTALSAIEGNTSGIYINTTGRGNCSIRCAKEASFVDGSHPVIEWYLLEEPDTGRFYYSRDLAEKKYLFTFPYDAYKYSFGVLQNGDIIAVFDADSITTDNKDDANRVNPYVFLAKENWAVCHEVDFGSSLKPCGWLGNSGYKVIANGDALFCEYTRQTTYTCNVWKLSGDPLDSSNWVVTKSFVVTSTDNATLFKHAHMIMQDFYTGICYMSTGDDLIGAMMWASTDNGATWTQLVSPDSDGQVNQYGYINGSEKYCRCLTMTFTKDYIYWATDSSSAVLHYLFRAERDTNGVLDYSTVEDWVNIPANNGASTYGTAYIPELDAIVLLDRCDVVSSEMDLKLVTLNDGVLHTFGKLESASGERNVGFRTRFSEWYPKNGLIHFGFALHIGRLTNAVNQNKGFNNAGSGDKPTNNVNNLSMRVFKVNSDFGMAMNTEFI